MSERSGMDMKRKTFPCFLCVLWALFSISLPAFPSDGSPLDFPANGFVEGWQKKGPVRQFTRNGLYGHINGGSELFLEFGFEILRLQKYQNGSDEISVEAYRMESAEAALAIYLMKCGKETPVPGIPARNTGDHHQITLLKGNYFVTVNNFGGKSSLLPVLLKLANETLKNLPDRKPADLFALLPKQNRVNGSELLIRGYYSLQSIYTLGEGDVLLLKNKIFGAAAEYKEDGKEDTFQRIVVRYPDETYAQEAFSHLRANLDSYIQVLENHENFLSFKDYRGKYGKVSLEKDLLHIFINLSKPSL